ncbi:MAG: hypothetical protein ABIZ34_09565 [Candidatus Limnocylindrales bacterium]
MSATAPAAPTVADDWLGADDEPAGVPEVPAPGVLPPHAATIVKTSKLNANRDVPARVKDRDIGRTP